MAGVDIALGMTGGAGGEGSGCTEGALSDEESVSLLASEEWKPVTSDGTL